MTVTQYICSVSVSRGHENDDKIEDEVPNLVSYLNDFCSKHNLDMEFKHKHYFAFVSNLEYNDESSYAQAVVQDIYDNDNYAVAKDDIFVIPHGNTTWGYGKRAYVETDNGIGVHGCLVYAGVGSVPWETRGFVWHEVGHAMWSGHGEGQLYLTDDPDDTRENMYAITPMCMSYLHSARGIVDTNWDGGSTEVSEFCDGKEDWKYVFRNEGGDNASKRDNHTMDRYAVDRYGVCARRSIRDWIQAKTF